MRGNNYQLVKESMEDEIIHRIDMPHRIKSPEPARPSLKVTILELIGYKAAIQNKPIQFGKLNVCGPC
jgi:hypothetical protein